MRRTIALAAGVLAGAAALTVASPAAHADNPTCPKNRFCLFEHDDFLGGRAVFSRSDTNLTNNFWQGTHRAVHNGASSMINNMGVRVTLRGIDGSCTGRTYDARPESEDRDFSNNDFDNEASCIQVNPSGR